MYDLGDDLLMVASDRISTFDVVHPDADPGQGPRAHRHVGVLVRADAATSSPTTSSPPPTACPSDGRAAARCVVAQARMLPVECVVRGYLAGSGWKEYQRTGTVCGIALPRACRSPSSCPEPIFTPATKAEAATRREHRLRAGGRAASATEALAERLRERVDRALPARRRPRPRARHHPRRHEVRVRARRRRRARRSSTRCCTPDSSRFWPADEYEPGPGQPSFDKQYVRDWARGTAGTRRRPRRRSPTTSSRHTRERYVEAYERITGEPFGAWLERTGRADARARVLIRPEGRDPRPAGPGGRARAAGARVRGRGNVHVGRLIELDVDDRAAPEMCERLSPTRSSRTTRSSSRRRLGA